METATLRGQYSSDTEYGFLFYEDRFKKLPNIKQNQDGGFSLKIGNRILKSIDFTNEYEGFYETMKTRFFALEFSYTINHVFPELPKINREFKGKAQAYLDQTDGHWKLYDVALENEINEYLEEIHRQYGSA